MNKLLLLLIAALTLPIGVTTTHAQKRGNNKAASRPATNTVAKPSPRLAPQATTSASPTSTKLITNKEESCGCESPLPDVLATVNGIKITAMDIDAPNNLLEEQVRNLENQVVEARQRELDLQINSKLLEAEAKKRAVPTTKLLETEVVAKVKEPTEAEAQAFYDANKARIQGEFSAIKNDIIAYLRNEWQREESNKFAAALRATAQVKVLADKLTPPVTAADRARVLATINGEPITSGNIEDNLRPMVYSLREEVYARRKAALDTKINDILLEQEAKKRNTTSQAVLDEEIKTKIKVITEADAQAFFNQNKNQINGDFAQTKDQLIQYLQTQEGNKAISDYAAQLRRGATIQTFLTAPEPPVFNIATDDQPTKGSPTAKVTIVEFTDFECPSCAQMHPVIEQLASEYGDRIRIVVRDFPLSQHKQAFKAAEAAEAAREQGKYWEYVNLLFANQKSLDVAQLKEYASQVGLNRQTFDVALDSGKFAAKVQRDLQDGNQLGVDSTPTVFVNGRRIADRSYQSMKTVIDAAIKDSGKR